MKQLEIYKEKGLQVTTSGEGQVEFFMSTWTDPTGAIYVDRQGEVNAATAFTNTLPDFAKWHWWVNHGKDPRWGWSPVGIFDSVEIAEIDNVIGVKLKGTINLATAVGQEIFAYYKFMQENNRKVPHSFGFRAKQRYDAVGDVWVNDEIMVFEVSTLTMPAANEHATQISVKSEAPAEPVQSAPEPEAAEPIAPPAPEPPAPADQFFKSIIKTLQND